MENKKFEQLIDLIINEQEDKARELFHDIVVEKSREIYENIMSEEMEEMDEMSGQVGDLMDEITAEEQGVAEAEGEEAVEMGDEEEGGDDADIDFEAGEEAGEASDEEAHEELHDVKDKFEDLLADFERILAGHADDEEGEEAGEEDMMEASDEEEEMDEEVMEAVQLQKVSVTHGDDGSNKKSPALNAPKVKTAGVNPVKFSGDSEAVPAGPKGPSNEYSKKEGELPGAGKFKNVPGGKAKVDLAAAPKPVTKDGSAGGKSPVAKG